ncbi:type I glyceraldehyde-3-phosphate dehydrogenase [Campylobacter sp. 19-13652]|uniref:type I glyceraldehyde-3-phosphate dehydrogenase n=1 Tax=Campylobacter sp. 19-13652 TaxID=2840180 RepID=UPI001C77D221|nr:type I glyceraldehyde-3-phosphate dehydrogenase [Campylobacter sp. 19-13652]BCX79698.1 glyceraldehyde-3-phosphate dehydrogenase [Campylobacter sp. 19-13652]
MAVKMAINGFGRIGRCVARIILERDDVELVAINDTATRDLTRYLLKYDSVHGEFKHSVNVINDDYIEVDGKKIRVFSTREADELGFSDFGAQVVLECTGAHLSSEKCEKFINRGVGKVIMSAPAKDDTPTYVYGVNSDSYAGEAIISNASCTTNCLAPVAKVLDDKFGIDRGLMTTIHSYTHGQSIVDAKCAKDVRRGRAGAANMGPTSTGAAKAIGLVMPHLKGRLNGISVRVPTVNVSMIDLTAVLKRSVSAEELNEAFKEAERGYMAGVLAVDSDKRVSSDFNGSGYSSIVIEDMTRVVADDTVKVLAWYDNEWGYSQRLVDMAALMVTK